MDFTLKLKALESLVTSRTEDAAKALQKEFSKVIEALKSENDYEALEQALEIMSLIAQRFPKDAVVVLVEFVHTVSNRDLDISKKTNSSDDDFKRFYNPSKLIISGTNILLQLRYIDPVKVMEVLLLLSRSGEEEVVKKALDALRTLASYDIQAFYGTDDQPPIGGELQRAIISELSTYDDQNLSENFQAITELIDRMLALEARGTTWAYNAATISRLSIRESDVVANIRTQSVDVLIRLYALKTSIVERLRIITSLTNATRAYGVGLSNDATMNMVANNALKVLEFFEFLCKDGSLQIIQKIEHNCYWIYHQTLRDDVKESCRKIESSLNKNSEYQIYKALIGFEGIFSDWDKPLSDRDFETVEKSRKELARKYASGINDQNYREWQQRIVEFSKTESNDLATFPTFFYFLEQIAESNPDQAFALLSDSHSEISAFITPLMRGLWDSKWQNELRDLCKQWIREGLHLNQCARQFLDCSNVDREIVTLLLEAAVAGRDANVLSSLVTVSVTNFTVQDSVLKSDVFIPALKALNDLGRSDWIYDSWFRKEAKQFLDALSEDEIKVVLASMLLLQDLEFHAEEILYLIAKKYPLQVFDVLNARIKKEERPHTSTYEAIPFSLHKLNEPLSKHPREIVDSARKQYKGIKEYSFFVFRGARLVKIVFPDFSEEFQDVLSSFVRSGKTSDCEFVLAILRNYDGIEAIQKLCIEIVRMLPFGSKLLAEVACVLQSTGVVQGEYGLTEAYQKKKEQLSGWLNSPDEKVRSFVSEVIDNLQKASEFERRRADEDIALRKLRYGEA